MIIKRLYEKGFLLLEDVTKVVKKTEPGSLKYLLWGEQPSKQSISVKMGKWGEKWFAFLVEETPNFSMLPHGVLNGIGEDGKSKDIDFLFKDDINKIVYYREFKGNIELDTEKLPATYEKIKFLKKYLKKEYPNYSLDYGCFNWCVFNKKPYVNEVRKYLNKIKKFEENNVPVSFPCDMFKILGVDITEKDYLNYFRKIGKKIETNN